MYLFGNDDRLGEDENDGGRPEGAIQGVGFSGNGSAIGASANVIVVGMAERAGQRISFMKFAACGAPIMVLTIFVAMIYVWLRYYYFG